MSVPGVNSRPRARFAVLASAVLAVGLLHATHVHASSTERPASILLRNAYIISGEAATDTVSANLLIEGGDLAVVTLDRLPASEADLVVNARGGFVVGRLVVGKRASFIVLDADPREDVEVLLDTRSHAVFAIHEGEILVNLLEVSSEPEEPEPRRGWLAYTPPPMALPTGYLDEDRWNRWDTRWVSGIFTAGLVLDRQNWLSWDAGSETQVGDLSPFSGGEVRGFRIGAIGTINFERPWVYTLFGATHAFDKGFDASTQDDFSLLDWRLDAALPWDVTISVGKQKEPISLERVMSLAFNPMQERTAAADAMLPARNVGVVISGTAVRRHITWGIGAFNDWFDVGQSFDESATQYVGRATSAITLADEDSNLLHLGLNFRYSNAREGVRYATEPEFNSAPLYHDTGLFGADAIHTWGGELGWRAGPFWLQSEALWSNVQAPASGDPGFFGYHVAGNWVLTGEMRGYNRRTGVMGSVPVSKSVYDGGKGAWELSARWSELDLTDGTIDGGHSRIASLGINWWLTPFFQVNLNYRHIELDRLGTTGVSDGINTRILLLLE